ncbi:MAG: hypothetical protein AUK47_07405 [Deltaproteobacteria bacterium CG2_30_63_29]|nr:MAG: hypothetical protein AUK47_07405 [Deltaproteobacteria bacterium CG2_30_63_29]PJB43567.1 MAG: hypothetical protein CO108_09845 [Deltaproteobacteria bacterium CG_4_9_14_3_um_filter_63_12]
MRVAFVTAGDVGAGHVAHAYAIHQGLRRAGSRVEFRAFGPAAPFPFVAHLPFIYEPIAIDFRPFLERETALQTPLALALALYAPDLVLVDLFWAPLLYIFETLQASKWLLARKCPDAWWKGTPRLRFEPRQYDRIIVTEPVEHPNETHRIAPLVVANRDELEPVGALRAALGVSLDEQLVVVAHAGVVGEAERLDPGYDQVRSVRFDAYETQFPFPLARWLNDADVIFAGGGYNTVWESLWLGYHDRVHFTGFPRNVDDQQWRIECARTTTTMKENGADPLARWILAGG